MAKQHRKQNRRQKPNRPTNKISDHFSKRDFSCKCGECNQAVKISLGLVGGLELLRSKVNKRINIIQGYQCPDSAEKERKIRRNFHLVGVAAKITAEDLDPKQLFLAAEEIPEFKGIGLNLTEKYVHVDTRKQEERTLWVEERELVTEINEGNRKSYFE